MATPIPASSEINAVVLDPGSGYMKCGFGGDDSPRAIFKNMIGKPRATSVTVLADGDSDAKVYVGEEAERHSAILDLYYTIKDGMIQNWDAFKIVIGHALETELRVEAEQCNVLLTEAPSNARDNRKRMFDTIFNDFQVSGAQCQVQAVLALYASGRTTGMVLDSGDGVTHTVPVFRGFGVKSAVAHAKNAGRNVSQRALECLNKYHAIDYLNQPNGLEIARKLKEEACRVSLNYDEEMEEFANNPDKKVTYTFADLSTVDLGETVIEPAEVLYKPEQYGINVKSLPMLYKTTYDACNVDMRLEMTKNTVMSGGTTCISGYSDRAEKEFKELVPTEAKNEVRITVPDDRKFAVFAGGSILCCLTSFENQWIKKEEWEEDGYKVMEDKKLF